MSEIVLIKLVSGEEVIGKVLQPMIVDGVAIGIVLGKPRILAVRQNPNGDVGLVMMPFLAGTPDGDATIFHEKIMAESSGALPKELEDGYLQQTSSIHLG